MCEEEIINIGYAGPNHAEVENSVQDQDITGKEGIPKFVRRSFQEEPKDHLPQKLEFLHHLSGRQPPPESQRAVEVGGNLPNLFPHLAALTEARRKKGNQVLEKAVEEAVPIIPPSILRSGLNW